MDVRHMVVLVINTLYYRRGSIPIVPREHSLHISPPKHMIDVISSCGARLESAPTRLCLAFVWRTTAVCRPYGRNVV